MKYGWGTAIGIGMMATGVASACEAGRGLKAIMAESGTVSKALTAQLANATKSEDSAAKAGRLRALALESLSACVERIEEMTDAGAKRLAYLDYQKSIAELYALETELEAALVKGDVAAAKAVNTKINGLKLSAHPKFRKPEN